MEDKFDSVPRKLDKKTQPPSEEAARAMAAAQASAVPGAPAAPGPFPEVNTQLTEGTGVYCYKAENARYGLAETIAALREIADILSRRYPSRRFGVGDISLRGGGDIAGHASHERGVDIDVRPLRDDWAEAGVVYQSSDYSREFTQELIDLFWTNSHLGLQFVFFNDAQTQGTRPWPHHDNHFHVRFHHPGEAAAPPILGRGNEFAAANNELQRCLNFWKNATAHPGADLVVDGDFGQRTYDRVREFQSSEGLPVDGVAGGSTWERLQGWRSAT